MDKGKMKGVKKNGKIVFSRELTLEERLEKLEREIELLKKPKTP